MASDLANAMFKAHFVRVDCFRTEILGGWTLEVHACSPSLAIL
jgi:hypothetical protein